MASLPANARDRLRDAAFRAGAVAFGVADAAAFDVGAPPGQRPGDLLPDARAVLARYKVPERWVFVDAFTRTPMGKIPKAPLRALFA